RNVVHRTIATERVPIEKAQRTHCLIEVTPGDLTLLYQIYLILTNLFRTQQFGRFTEMPREVSDVSDVGLDGARRTITQLQVIDHTLTKSSHEKLLSKREMFVWRQTLSPRMELLHYALDRLLEVVKLRVGSTMRRKMFTMMLLPKAVASEIMESFARVA